MSVRLTGEVEAERVKRAAEARKTTKWEIHRTISMAEASRLAKDWGWKDNKVQIRIEQVNGEFEYVIEPYEEGCGCSGILKYTDIYGLEDT